MRQCEFCKKDVETPCINARDTEECSELARETGRPGDEIHAGHEDDDHS